MITKRNGFNNGAQGKIDLNDYSQIAHPQQSGKFIKFGWLDLDQVDPEDPTSSNYQVRAEGTTRARIDEFKNEFLNNGWNTKDYPPIVGTEDQPVPRDGRARILAAKENGERWIPVAIFSYPDCDTEDEAALQMGADGIIANLHRPSKRSVPEDFKLQAVNAINAGLLEPEKTEIENYLINKCMVDLFWSPQCGVRSRIVNDVMREVASGSQAMVTKERDGWKSWVKNKVDDDESVIVVCVGNSMTPSSTWRDVIMSEAKKKQHPKIVLYSKKPYPEEVQKDMKRYCKDLEKFFVRSYNMVNASVFGNGLAKYTTDEQKQQLLQNKPWTILGAVPQFADHHDINGSSLVAIDDYLQA